ncbi:ParB/Srx family N-terminal domain-containing protein [Spiroplasma endosymbiont of Ammophila pubescens]|uniref:ParB/Srx family N-terminal domain-containing protein n=1 Tax=Spiroplasma endosymbiont of Ammophila pubescens TaxID=3066315 RepID=UPI0032B2AE24
MEEINFKDLYFPEYSDINIAQELLKYEGDLSGLLELIVSIKNNGFLYINDKILIYLDKDSSFYYILEGNRRLLAIKLINKEFSFGDVCGDKPFYENTKQVD